MSDRSPEILPVMIGTAGHVDHGKTSLIRNLTGCDTDRLKEEKKRGLSIDLGFAACRFGDGRLAGVVDVPGHEDFIRNMAAGAACMDVVLLVIAADDGIMPQTIEHLRILRALGTPQLLVALTKIDLVDPEWVPMVSEEIQGFLAGQGFADVDVLPVSNISFSGLDRLRGKLQQLVEQVERAEQPMRFRMPVERVFSVKGYGTVVTGVPICGRAGVGDRVTLLPSGTKHTVRAIQSYKLERQLALPGACAAINLRDLEAEQVHRGMTLVAEGSYGSCREFVCRILSEDETRKYKRILPVSIHTGTAGVQGRIKLIDCESLEAGRSAMAQVHLDDPLCLIAGDRLIVRSLSPSVTIGGGVVLSVQPQKIKRSQAGLSARLQAGSEAAEAGQGGLSELLAGPTPCMPLSVLKAMMPLENSAAEESLSQWEDDGRLVRLNDACLAALRIPEMAAGCEKILSRYHERHSTAWGMKVELFAEFLGLEGKDARSLIKVMGGPFVVRHGAVALRNFEPALSRRQMEWRDEILLRVEQGEAQPPARGNLKKDLAIPESDLKLVLRLLEEEQAIVLVGTNLLLPGFYEHCRNELLAIGKSTRTIELTAFREATGVGRNLAIALLEHFDGLGMTRRDGNVRVLLNSSVVSKEQA